MWPEADDQADCPHHEYDERVAYYVSDGAAGEDRRFGHRKRAKAVDQPTLQVGGQANTGAHCTKNDGLGKDASHQVVDIAGAGNGDRSTKHVAEEQDEHDRLDCGEDQLLRDAWDLDQVALCQDKRIGDCLRKCGIAHVMGVHDDY